MKKSIIMTIIMVMIISLIGVVNAANETATVSIAGKKEVKKGDKVTVTMTVNSKKAVVGADFTVNYDSKFLKFVESSALAANANEAGKIVVEHVATSGIKEITFTFEVIGKEGSSNITATPSAFTAGTTEEDEIKVDSIKGPFVVSIAKAAETTKPKDETTPKEEEETPKAKDTTPKTGSVNVAPVVAVSAIAGLAVVAIAIKKIRK